MKSDRLSEDLHMAKRDQFLLRLSPGLLAKIRCWADDEFRSMNGQIEYLLTNALRNSGRLNLPLPPQADGSFNGDPQPLSDIGDQGHPSGPAPGAVGGQEAADDSSDPLRRKQRQSAELPTAGNLSPASSDPASAEPQSDAASNS